MSPLPVISNRHPFAPPALPEFIARMGASAFRPPPPSSSLFTLGTKVRDFLHANDRISLVTA
jgi:hypothetical protein